MTHEGVKRVMRVMCASYPNFHPANMQETIAIWESVLDRYEDSQIAMALKAFIATDTSGFAPAVGQLISLTHEKGDELSELEAWGMVQKAMRNGIYNAESEYGKLPDDIRKAVGSPGQIREWAMQDGPTGVAQSNFLRSYRAVVERNRKAERLPPEMARIYQREAPEIGETETGDDLMHEGVAATITGLLEERWKK